MTPALSHVYDALLLLASAPELRAHAEALRRDFELRTQSTVLPPAESVPESRIRAAWDDALTRGGLADGLADRLADPAQRALARVIARAHRGLFRWVKEGGQTLLWDVIGGAEFILLPRDDIGSGLFAEPPDDDGVVFDGRVVAASDGCALLPGVLFHPPEATAQVLLVVEAARSAGLDGEVICDGLLRMEHNLRCLARVRVAYAYRLEELVPPARQAVDPERKTKET